MAVFDPANQSPAISNHLMPSFSEPPKIMSQEERKRHRNVTTKNARAGSKVGTSYKTILLGDSNVGKTSLFVRLTQETFEEKSSNGPTLQMDVARKTFRIDSGRL